MHHDQAHFYAFRASEITQMNLLCLIKAKI